MFRRDEFNALLVTQATKKQGDHHYICSCTGGMVCLDHWARKTLKMARRLLGRQERFSGFKSKCRAGEKDNTLHNSFSAWLARARNETE